MLELNKILIDLSRSPITHKDYIKIDNYINSLAWHRKLSLTPDCWICEELHNYSLDDIAQSDETIVEHFFQLIEGDGLV